MMIAPTPHAAVIALIGGLWSVARRMAMPCPFCTTSTVIAIGTTSSIIARQENAGAYRFGRTSANISAPPALNLPSTAIMSAPTIIAPITGGSTRVRRGETDNTRNTIVIGAAIQNASRIANTRSSPKRRNTPATMPMTIGIGIASMKRLTQPESPSTSMSTPQAMYAPMTSWKLKWSSAGPTSTVPGIVQKKTSGCR